MEMDFLKETEKLPDDTIIIILSFLTPAELCSVHKVSKNWSFSQISQTNIVWKRAYEEHIVDYEPNQRIMKKIEKLDSLKKRIAVLLEEFRLKTINLLRSYISQTLNLVKLDSEQLVVNSEFNPKRNQKLQKKGNTSFLVCKKGINSVKIVFVGDKSVGKTSFLMTNACLSFPEKKNVPRIFDNYTENVNFGGKSCVVGLWDTSEFFAEHRKSVYTETTTVVLCFAMNDRSSFENLGEKWISEIRENLPGIPIVLAGNKSDLVGNEKNVVKLEEIKKFMRKNKEVFAFVSSSAKNMKKIGVVIKSSVCSSYLASNEYEVCLRDNERKCILQ